jgi:hypothetical protein
VLLVLVKKQPPAGRKLLIIGTLPSLSRASVARSYVACAGAAGAVQKQPTAAQDALLHAFFAYKHFVTRTLSA